MGLLLSLSDEGEGVPERALGGEMEGLLWGVCGGVTVTHVSLFLGALCW